MIGSDVCYMHGGKTPRGIESPGFKHGRYSKALPKHLHAAYDRTRTDPTLIHLNDELGIVDARIESLLATIDRGESAGAWEALAEQWTAYESAKSAKDTAGMASAVLAMGQIITQGASDAAAWKSILAAVSERRKLANTQRMILMDQTNAITAQQAMTLAQTLVGIIRMRVRDPKVVQQIHEDLGAALMLGPGERVHDRVR